MAKSRQRHLFPELDSIIATIQSDKRHDLVVLFIPSHDKKQNPLNNQDQWAKAAGELFADLFTGATAFHAFAGFYKTEDGIILHDQPITIEAYVVRERLIDRANLTQLLEFAKRMGRETNQAAVGLVINHVFYEITRF
jgi:hypothetical protein